MKKVRIKNVPPYANKYFPIMIFIGTLLMGIGYTSINSNLLNINGNVAAKEYEGVFITDTQVIYDTQNTNDDNSNGKVNLASGTLMNSSIELSDNNESFISFRITIYNNSNSTWTFDGVNYTIGEDTYDNESIVFDNLDGLALDDKIVPGESKIFTITFHYKENSAVENKTLNSILNFKFIKKFTISFDANGGIVDVDNKIVIYGEKYNELPIPIREDYIFDGWYTSEINGDLIEENTIVAIDNDITLYAHWSLEKYTIIYNVDDRLTIPYNPTTYDRESEFTINNPILNRMGYRFKWTEEIYTTNWKNGFINLTTGAFEEYNSTYPNAVISEKIFLKAGVTYTINGISEGQNRWRFFDVTGNYIKNSSSLSFTPDVDGYVIILIHNGADQTTRNNIRIFSSHGDTIFIPKGSTGNRIYNFVLVPTKVVIADIFERDEVTINGNTPQVNSDGSVSFDSSQNFNNIIVKLPDGDYSKGVTIGLDVYLKFPDVYTYTGDLNEVQTLLMARTSTANSVFLFQWQSKMHWDLGDASNYRNVLDKDLTKTGRYLFLLSYGPDSDDVNRTIIMDKSTNAIIYNKTDKYSMESLNSGISLANNELQIGGDYYKTNGYTYDAEPQTKFYSYFFDNIAMNTEEIESLIYEFGYGNVEI